MRMMTACFEENLVDTASPIYPFMDLSLTMEYLFRILLYLRNLKLIKEQKHNVLVRKLTSDPSN